jgi:hypothetical protein
MQFISDDFMRQMLATTKAYTVMILKAGPNKNLADAAQIIWEHGRRNFALRADGKISIICPINDGSGISGVAIFNAPEDEVRRLMDDDPGVKAGIFTYELHPCRSFPGDTLPSA